MYNKAILRVEKIELKNERNAWRKVLEISFFIIRFLPNLLSVKHLR